MNDAFDVVTICYNDNVSLVSSCFSTFELEAFRSLIRLSEGRLGQKRRSRNRSSRRPIESDVKLDHDKFQSSLGGGFQYFLFSPLFGEDSHFD